MAKLESILEAIGRTPVVRLDALAPAHVRIYVKLESRNPGGSVKDRLALGVIEDAERTGALKPGQTVIEATSGNTGIGLAMVCARKGYPLVVVMGEQFSVERRKLMRYLGAKVVLTPAWAKGSGMLAKATELAETHGWFLCRQFENPANADVHARTTAREIIDDFSGDRLDYFVTGVGTGGTLAGVGRVLRAERPDTKIVLCEPGNSPMLGSKIPMPATGSHPLFRPHLIQGWAPDFISKLTADAIEQGFIDQIAPIDSGEAMRLSHELARREGICTGVSGGATLSGALQIAADAAPGTTILCMLPDTGERYLSTPLFDSIGADMTSEEAGIAISSPSFRFDAPGPSVPDEVVAATAEVTALVNGWLADPAQPVVMFAFAWCEYCWALRKFFAAAGIAYRSVDLDSTELQKEDLGGAIRTVVGGRTGARTIPQVFVGGQLVGGATDTLRAFQEGRLQTLFDANGVRFDHDYVLDPEELLPRWRQRKPK
ncbi:MAG: pyridoxal-phosphate dependent enzyme [Deltaproteobacteria bacterium]|nr:pyridoxal-phosphate dependent enzyme [Deltaproteobacteria bacterium]